MADRRETRDFEPCPAALHRQACEAGSLVGCTRWGEVLHRGLGCKRDDKASAEVLKRACDAGEMESSLPRTLPKRLCRRRPTSWMVM